MKTLDKKLPLNTHDIDVLTVGEVLIDMIELDGAYHPFFGCFSFRKDSLGERT